MATQTTGVLGLTKPEATDKPKTFRPGYNSNMDKIDEAISACGPFMFEISENNHLLMYYQSPLNPNEFSINSNGHLIWTLTTND